MKILSSIKTALGSVIHVVEAPFSEAENLGSLFATAEKDGPALKAAGLQLVALVEAVGADGAADVAGSGLNVASDIKTFQDVAAVYSFVKGTVVPLLKQVYGDVKADFTTQDSPTTTTNATTAADAAKDAVQTGPGLHNSVPA